MRVCAFHTVFFDVGGTLIGAPDIFSELAERLDPARKEDIAEFLAEGFRKRCAPDAPFLGVRAILARALREAAAAFGVPDLGGQAAAIYRETFVDRAWAFPETVPVLRELRKRRCSLFVLSDADAPVLREELRVLRLAAYFRSALISSELRAYKPSDRTVRAALGLCRGHRSGIMLVGDSRVDVETAKKMGVVSVLVRRIPGQSFGADHVISSLLELLPLMEKGRA